jgi:hypothetical protein
VNFDQLSRNVGRSLRLRPHPQILDASGARRNADDSWLLESVDLKARTVTFRHVYSGRQIELFGDNIREYQNPDFIVLRCEVTLTVEGFEIEPLIPGQVSQQTQASWVDSFRARARLIGPEIVSLLEQGNAIEREIRGDGAALQRQDEYAARCEQWRSAVGSLLTSVLPNSGAAAFVLVKQGPTGLGRVAFEHGRLVACLDNLRAVQERLENWIFRSDPV